MTHPRILPPTWKQGAFTGLLLLSGLLQVTAAEEIPLRDARFQAILTEGNVTARFDAGEFTLLRAEPDADSETLQHELVPGWIQITLEGERSAEWTALQIADGQWMEQQSLVQTLDESVRLEITDPRAASDSGLPFEFTVHEETGGDTWASLRLSNRLPLAEESLDGMTITPSGASQRQHTLKRRVSEGGQVSWSEPEVTRESYQPLVEIRVDPEAPLSPAQSNLKPGFLFYYEKGRGEVTEFAETRMLMEGQGTRLVEVESMEDTEGGFENREVKLTWRFSAGQPRDLGTFRFAEKIEEWLPEAGGTLRIEAELKNSEVVAQVEALRLLLKDVSQHPGIAINAGANLLLAPRKEMRQWTVQTDAISWKRVDPSQSDHPLDQMADAFFEIRNNPRFHLQGDIQTTGLPEPVSDSLLTREISRKTRMTLSMMDHAAQGSIEAQVLIDGIWENLQARGPHIEGEESFGLPFPVDRNANRVADAFEKQDGQLVNDGLSLFEHYRGAWLNGAHERLDPETRDVFVVFSNEAQGQEVLESLEDILKEADVRLHSLLPTLMRDGFLDFHQESNLSVILVEKFRSGFLPAVMAIHDPSRRAKAWQVIRPVPESRVLFTDPSRDREVIPHLIEDLRTMLDLSVEEEVDS